jgi:26S proteasome regulatory subunit T5
MSTLEDLDDLEREGKEEDKKDEGDKDKKPTGAGDAEMKDAADEKKEEEEELDEEILKLSTRDIVARRRLLENDTRIMRSEFQRLTHEKAAMGEKIKDNLDKIENNRCVSFAATSTSRLALGLASSVHLLITSCQTTALPRR